ncbi:hypothetical protein BH09VER1_BH09VER1_48360 [soil metagenome]
MEAPPVYSPRTAYPTCPILTQPREKMPDQRKIAESPPPAEAALLASEQRYRDLVRMSSDAIFLHEGGTITFINDAGLRMLHANRADQVEGRSPLDLIHPRYHDIIRPRIARLLEEPIILPPIEEELLALDGTTVFAEVSASSYFSEGQLIIQVICRDTTQRRLADDSMRQERSFSDAVLNSLPGVLYLYDQNGKFLRWNKNFERVTGYHSAEIAAMHPLDFFTPAEKSLASSRIAEVFQHGKSDLEAGFVAKDGQVIPYYFTGIRTQLEDKTCLVGVGLDISERKKAEMAARQLAAIVESSEDAIIGRDLNGLVISWNGGAQKIFGYARDEMLGQPMSRLIPADRQQVEVENIEKLRRGETLEHFETRRQTKDGRIIDVSVTSSPIKDDEGHIIGASNISRDITLAKEREHEIARLSRLYAALSQVNQAIVWSAHRDELFHKICEVLVEFGGFRMAWIGSHDPASNRLIPVACYGGETGYLDQINIYTDDRPEGHGPSGTAFRTNSSFICNDTLHDNSTAPWHAELERCGFLAAAVFPITMDNVPCAALTVYAGETGFFQDREIALLEEAAGDVSFALDNLARAEAHRLAEEARHASEARYHALFEYDPDGILIADSQSNYLDANPSACRMLGYARDELVGLHASDIVASSEVPHIETALDSIKSRSDYHREWRFRRKDGSTFPAEVMATTMPDGNLLGVIRDVTERHQAEAALRELNETLEHKVADRTSELESVNRELESFCYSVSHDLRAPLRAIAGFAQILAENYRDALDDTARNYFDRVLSATSRMGDLIDDLLNLSRVTRDELRHGPVDLTGLARSVVAALRQAAPERIAEVVVADGLETTGDPRLLRIMLENLLGNAWKFTSKSPAAHLEFTSHLENSERVFSIRDNGAGFDMRYAGKLFAPFQRLHRLSEFPGTGIGLATVQRIIHRHGGRVWAQAEVDRGATFHFTIAVPHS